MIGLAFVLLLALLAVATLAFILHANRRNPPLGRRVLLTHADGSRSALHVIERGDGSDGEPPLLFLHGACGNALDQLGAFGHRLPPTRRAIFVDRPGHGYSDRGPHASTPSGQADALVTALDALGIERAVVVGHSFGGAVALGMAIEHPERVAGLVLLAPASHPWPGAGTAWFYELAARPVLGRLFSWTLVVPFGIGRVAGGVAGVFQPQPVPADYARASGAALAIRPGAFRATALDVTRLHAWFEEHAARYEAITAPTVIVTGDEDRIVWPEVHAMPLARTIRDAKLVTVPGLGHKPDYVVGDLVVEAIEAVTRGQVGGFEPVVPRVPRASVQPEPDEIEPGIETGPDVPEIAR